MHAALGFRNVTHATDVYTALPIYPFTQAILLAWRTSAPTSSVHTHPSFQQHSFQHYVLLIQLCSFCGYNFRAGSNIDCGPSP